MLHVQTPGQYVLRLESVYHKVASNNLYHLVALRYRAIKEGQQGYVTQTITWEAPDGKPAEIGRYIMAQIFGGIPSMPELRRGNFWARFTIDQVIEYLERFVGSEFDVTVVEYEHKARKISKVKTVRSLSS